MYGNNARINHCKKLVKAPVKRDRNRTPSKCRLCIYYQQQFRYRICLFSICPYGKSRNTALGRKIAGHAEQTRVSLRAKLVEAQEEARRQNEERKPVRKGKDITR